MGNVNFAELLELLPVLMNLFLDIALDSRNLRARQIKLVA